jgi:MFS family permease
MNARRAYQILSGDDDVERACASIPDSVCTALPRNYFLNLLNGACGKLAQHIASPGLVIPWLLAALGASPLLIGLVVPVRQAAGLIPQMAAAAFIRGYPVRKWFWVGAGTVKAACLSLMIVAALVLPANAAGVVVLVLLAAFATAGGIGSLAFQDVVGKTIPKGRRGRLLAYRGTLGGALTLAAGALVQLSFGDEQSLAAVLWMLAGSAALWLLASLAFAAIDENVGATEGGRSMIGEVAEGFRLVRAVPGYRRFLVARILLISVEVATPFYALHASELLGGAAGAIGTYVFAVGLANLVANPFWGRFADASSRTVMAIGAGIAAAAGIAALALSGLAGSPYLATAYGAVFVLLGVANVGVQLGRKTYLVDAAPPAERPLYVAFTNTSVGVVTVATGGLGLVAQWLGVDTLLGLLVAAALLAALACLRTPEAHRMVEAAAGA